MTRSTDEIEDLLRTALAERAARAPAPGEAPRLVRPRATARTRSAITIAILTAAAAIALLVVPMVHGETREQEVSTRPDAVAPARGDWPLDPTGHWLPVAYTGPSPALASTTAPETALDPTLLAADGSGGFAMFAAPLPLPHGSAGTEITIPHHPVPFTGTVSSTWSRLRSSGTVLFGYGLTEAQLRAIIDHRPDDGTPVVRLPIEGLRVADVNTFARQVLRRDDHCIAVSSLRIATPAFMDVVQHGFRLQPWRTADGRPALEVATDPGAAPTVVVPSEHDLVAAQPAPCPGQHEPAPMTPTEFRDAVEALRFSTREAFMAGLSHDALDDGRRRAMIAEMLASVALPPNEPSHPDLANQLVRLWPISEPRIVANRMMRLLLCTWAGYAQSPSSQGTLAMLVGTRPYPSQPPPPSSASPDRTLLARARQQLKDFAVRHRVGDVNDVNGTGEETGAPSFEDVVDPLLTEPIPTSLLVDGFCVGIT